MTTIASTGFRSAPAPHFRAGFSFGNSVCITRPRAKGMPTATLLRGPGASTFEFLSYATALVDGFNQPLEMLLSKGDWKSLPGAKSKISDEPGITCKSYFVWHQPTDSTPTSNGFLAKVIVANTADTDRITGALVHAAHSYHGWWQSAPRTPLTHAVLNRFLPRNTIHYC